MPLLMISQVARQMKLRPSAIRYYEQIGVLPPPQRASGQRRYDVTTLQRLAVVQRARRAGFSLDEIRKLFFGFRPGVTPSQRWRKLADRKLAELEALEEQIKTMQTLLRGGSCQCKALEECGKKILEKECGEVGAKALQLNRRPRR